MKRKWKGKFIRDGKRARLQSLARRNSTSTDDAESTPTITENPPEVSTESGWGIGRRIVELGYLSEQLKACKYCRKPLHLHNIETEQRIGYASILHVTCDCGITNRVSTSKSHRPPDKEKRGMQVFDINTKAVLGVMHSGLTYRQMGSLMSTMEVKGLHHSNMGKREAEIHPYIQDLARESCSSVLQEEVNNEGTSGLLSGQQTGIFKYDMGWQKRGSGRAYDSKSGVGTLIGNNTGKICAYGVRVADCRICHNAKRNGNAENIPPHNCVKNWSGSAKAMEPDVGVNLVKSIEDQGVKVSTIIMDDDTTTMARLRKEIDHTITKWSDTNHTSKHLTNSLFSLQKKHRNLTNNVIAYLKKCFNYALAQTKGDAVQCKLQINQIVPHAFGDHSSCGEWCGHNKNPETYKYGTLTTNLSGDEFKKDLEAVFQAFSHNSEKIAPGGSTKEIESFNNMVAAKAPKRCHFSATGNILSRVGCAVAQKNLGNGYINAINEKIGLSPGKVYKTEAANRDTERKRQRLYSNKKENKLRKLQNKFRKRLELNGKEKKEGTTYKTAVAMVHPTNADIPPARQPPKRTPVNSIHQIVFCDIETGGLSKDTDILQIAACCEGKQFMEYIIPRKPISPASSKVTGLTSYGGVLFLNGTPVPAVPLKEALTLFLAWLEDMGQVVLVGHNFRIFDFPKLLAAFRNLKLEDEFVKVCTGGIDTLPLFKEVFPNMEKYKQEYLFETLLKEKYCAHNAIDDVISLEKLFQFSKATTESLLQHSFTTKWGFELQTFQDETARNSETLQCLVKKKVLSKQMTTKIASSGLCYSHLLTVFELQGKNGLVQLLSEKTYGVVRVTCSRKILDLLTEYFASVPM